MSPDGTRNQECRDGAWPLADWSLHPGGGADSEG